MDLTDYLENDYAPRTKTIMTCRVRLDKKTVLKALLSEGIIINCRLYLVPKQALIKCLSENSYGEKTISFEEANL